jgi:acyl carrier protein
MNDDVPPIAGETQSEQEIRALIRALILELAPTNGEAGQPDPRLVADLGYHSLALLELAFTLEDQFNLEPIDQEAAQHIVTAGDVEEYVIVQLGLQLGLTQGESGDGPRGTGADDAEVAAAPARS